MTEIGSSTNSRCTTSREWMEERHSSSCSEAMMCPSHEKPRSTVEPGTAPGPRRLVFVLAVAALMAGTSDAQAQPSGLVAGFSIGGGVLGVDRVTG